MPEREDGDLTEFVDLPLFGSAVAAAPSGNGARLEPAGDELESESPKAASAEGEQLRLL